MATLTTGRVAATISARAHLHATTATATYSLAAALAVNDVIQMVKIPSGATVTDVVLSVTDLDTGGAPAIVLEVGDGGDTDRFITASTIGQAGGVAYVNKTPTHTSGVPTAGCPFKYTVDDTIDIKVATGPQTGATTGILSVTVNYTMDA